MNPACIPMQQKRTKPHDMLLKVEDGRGRTPGGNYQPSA